MRALGTKNNIIGVGVRWGVANFGHIIAPPHPPSHPPLGAQHAHSLRRSTPRHNPLRGSPTRHAAGINLSALGVSKDSGAFEAAVGHRVKTSCEASDGRTGILQQDGPDPKRAKVSAPPPTPASCGRFPVKRKHPPGALDAVTDRLVAHILAKKVRLAAKVGETTARPPG